MQDRPDPDALLQRIQQEQAQQQRGRLKVSRLVLLNGSILLEHYKPLITQRLLLHPQIGQLVSSLGLLGPSVFAHQFGRLFPQPLPRAEIDAFNLARAQEMDLNKDGSVTADEARTFHEQQRAKRQAERFAKMDTNKDGKVSVQEIADGRGDWLMRKDANGDGQVSPDEMHSGRHGWRHGKHGE